MMRDVMNASGELWNEKLSANPRSVEELPRGSCGSGLGIVESGFACELQIAAMPNLIPQRVSRLRGCGGRYVIDFTPPLGIQRV